MKRKTLLLMLMFALGAPWAAWAQTNDNGEMAKVSTRTLPAMDFADYAVGYPTDGGSDRASGDVIGNGTNTSGNAPIYGLYKSSYVQMIYTATELQAIGISRSCLITKIGFNYSNTSNNSYGRNPVIYMCNTSKSSFSSNTDFVDYSSLEKVYDNNNHEQWTITPGWNEFELDTPFHYDGSSNIVIAVYCSLASGWNGSSFYCTSTGDNYRTIYAYNDSTNPDPETNDGNWSNYNSRGYSQNVPNLKIYYSITTLTLNTTTGGTVSGAGLCDPYYWYHITATPSSGYRFLYWKENGSVVNSDASTYVDMSSDHTYTAYFEPIYTNTATASPSAGGTVAFGSYTYDFDDNTTQGWTNIDADGDDLNWSVLSTTTLYWRGGANNGNNSSPDCMISGSYSNFGATSPDNYLVSPKIQLGGSITFYARSLDSSYPEQIAVAVSTHGNTSAQDFTTIITSVVQAVPDTWTQYTVDLSSYAGETGYVAIRNYGKNNYWYVLVDDITIVPGSGTSVSGTFCQNQSCSATATANSGYGFYRWSNGTTSTTTTFNVSAATTLTANFGPSVITMECGQTVSGTLGTSGVWGTGSSPYNMSSSWGIGGEAVYAFTPSLTGTHTIACNTTSGDPDFWVLSDYNPQTAIYSSGGGNISASLEAGHTYYIVADNYSSSNSAGYSIQVICPEPPLDVVVGSNGGTSSGSYLPVHFYFNNSLTQQIYTPEEIGYTGTIKKLSFYYNTGTSETRTITVYMKNTSTKTLSSFDSSPGTVVYNGSYTFSGTGWQTITLSTAFNYSSIGSNLMITVDMNGSYSSTRYFATYDTGENRAVYYCNDNTNPDPTSPPSPSGTCQYNNYIKLYMEDAMQYKFVSATVNGVGSVSYSPSGTTTPKGSRGYATGASLTLSASAGTNFSFSNWTENGSVVSTSASYNFTVSANRSLVANFAETPVTLPYTETFESNTWPMVNGDRTNKWYRGASGARNGSYGLFISSDGSNNTYNPDVSGAVWAYRTINFSETADYAISFDWRAEGESSYDYIRVGLVPASTTLVDGESFSAPTGWIDLNNSTYLNQQSTWQRKTTIINVTAGNYKLAFCWRNDGSVGYDPPAAIDNIEVRKALTVAVSAGTGGSVSGGGSFALNQRCTVTATPNSNYCFANWTEGGSVVSSNPTYTFDVTANRTLVANFVSSDDIAVSGTTTVNCGNTTTLTASGLTGVTYEWYSDASCTNLVATGASLTTPTLYDNTTYYVKAVKESVTEQYSTFDYTGSSQTYSIPSGASALKMEVWGAQGGGRQVDGNTNGGWGGNGGYSVGTLTNLSGVSSIYLYVGGQGETSKRQDNTVAPGGWNGGGTAFGSSSGDPACGGGGATDIRVGGTSLYYRIMVAGGGGGGGEDGEQGGYGGGTTGGAGSSSGTTGGTQTGGGTGYAFGIGASTQYDGGAGGGGWYGGGCGGGTQTIPTENSSSDSQGGCGGSGYVWTSSTASSAPSGYSVSSSYYLSDAQTIGGNSTMPNPFGGTMTGNQSNGYARITAIFNEMCETGAKAVTISVTQPAAPTNLQVSNVGVNTATVTWDANGESNWEYNYEGGSTWYTIHTNTVDLTDLNPGATYTFQVRSYSGDCDSETVSVEFTTESTHTVSVTVGEGGYYSGAGTFNHGASCTLTATPAPGYTFTGWYENNSLVSTDNPYTFSVLANHDFEARFSQNYYTISVSANPVEGGTIDQVEPSGSYQHNQNCILTAVPNTGWTFVNWTENGSEISTSNPLEFYATANRTLVANFVYTFTKDITGHQGGNGNWYLISSPLNTEIAPENVTNMVADPAENYDLYYFKQNAPVDSDGIGLEWINYKDSDQGGFTIEPTKGYLYANYNTVTLSFTGVPYQDNGVGSVSVDLTNTTDYNWSGWNLVGNPYGGSAYLDGPFYKMNPSGTDIVAVEISDLDAVIGPMEGVFVKYDDDEGYFAATFSPVSGAKVSSLALNVTKDRGLVDRAFVTFGGKRSMTKFQLNPSHTKVYIPKDDKDYAIVIAESDMDEMPVNFKAEQSGSYTLSVNAQEVSFAYLHLIDNMTGTDVDLLETPSYTFDATTTDYASRFKLVFATGNSNDDNFAFYSNGSFVINNDGEAMLQVVDVNGRIIKSESINGCTNINVNAAPGVYMLRLMNGDSEKVQKVVIR